MDLDYPAGPIIDKLAKLGNENAFTFGKPKTRKLRLFIQRN